MGFLMIPLTSLYDEYIDRSKLSEQKNPFEFLTNQEGSEQQFVHNFRISGLYAQSCIWNAVVRANALQWRLLVYILGIMWNAHHSMLNFSSVEKNSSIQIFSAKVFANHLFFAKWIKSTLFATFDSDLFFICIFSCNNSMKLNSIIFIIFRPSV